MMDIFNLIAGIASILSFLVAIFVASKVVKIDNSMHIKQSIKGDNNRQAGRDNK